MIAYCGLDCEQCEAFIATQRNDDAMRVKVAEEWSRVYHTPIKPEDINCTGCRSAGMRIHYCEELCEIRKCATRLAVGSCGDCTDYPCATLTPLLQVAPQAKARLDARRDARDR